MSEITFHKMHGCGNDFLFVDAMRAPKEVPASSIPALCDRHFGLGADGIAVLSPGQKAQAKWKFYNNDGSEAEMCGNAARCATLFLAENYFPKSDWISIETLVGVLKGRKVDNNLVEVELPLAKGIDAPYEEKLIKHEDGVLRLYCIDTGVPHAVIEVEDIYTYPLQKIGAFLVRHSAFPKGTNVTFFQKLYLDEIFCTTFERGVEAETYACGTGVAAGSLVYSQLYAQKFPIRVRVPGGTLSVNRAEKPTGILLKGPAHYVGEVQLKANVESYQKKTLYSEGNRPCV